MTNDFENRLAKNRTSPKNENDYIEAYLKLNPMAKKVDGLDISAVTTKDGTRGHGLMNESLNRGKDKDYHRVKDFIPDKELHKVRSN